MILKSYIIANDVTSGAIDIMKLTDEILTSGAITGHFGIVESEDETTFNIESSGSINNESLLDSTILNHTI